MSPNYPDDYPNNYEQVILKFQFFPYAVYNNLGMETAVSNWGACHTHICNIQYSDMV